MTQITLSLELLLSGIASLLVLGVGGTWKVVNAINAGREKLKGEFTKSIDELWNANKDLENKWDRKADAVHKRIGDQGKRHAGLATEVAGMSGTLGTILRETRNGNGHTATRRTKS